MTSRRVTSATITVVSFLGLILFVFLMGGLNVRKVKAQRPEGTFQIPVSSPPAIKIGKGMRPTQPAASQRLGDEAPVFNPYDASSAGFASSAGLMQPIVVAIKDGPQLRGEPVKLSALQVETIFGRALIPVSRIAGFHAADDPRQPATICLSNGDSLTGVLATDPITIKTEWGSATIGRDHIVSIVTNAEPVTWEQHDGRWRIIPGEPEKREADKKDTGDEVGEVDARAQPTRVESPTPTD